jgi:integrase
LLIARLGLRGVDIRRLEFADFDWAGNRLFVVQAKTGDRVQLPLLKEVGWAVIDYIRHGRPDSDCPVPCQTSRNGSELIFSVLVRPLSDTR